MRQCSHQDRHTYTVIMISGIAWIRNLLQVQSFMPFHHYNIAIALSGHLPPQSVSLPRLTSFKTPCFVPTEVELRKKEHSRLIRCTEVNQQTWSCSILLQAASNPHRQQHPWCRNQGVGFGGEPSVVYLDEDPVWKLGKTPAGSHASEEHSTVWRHLVSDIACSIWSLVNSFQPLFNPAWSINSSAWVSEGGQQVPTRWLLWSSAITCCDGSSCTNIAKGSTAKRAVNMDGHLWRNLTILDNRNT